MHSLSYIKRSNILGSRWINDTENKPSAGTEEKCSNHKHATQTNVQVFSWWKSSDWPFFSPCEMGIFIHVLSPSLVHYEIDIRKRITFYSPNFNNHWHKFTFTLFMRFYTHTHIHTHTEHWLNCTLSFWFIYIKIYAFLRVPGWLSPGSIWPRLRSWSHGLLVWAPHRTMCWQFRAWSLLRIHCLPLFPLLPRSRSVSLKII